MKVFVTKSCPTLCNPLNYSLPGSSVYGIPRQEYQSGFPFPSLGNLLDPEIKPMSPALQADSLLSEPPGKPKTVQHKEAAKANEKESHSLLGSP